MSRCNPKGRDINGIILLDKDIGLSSNVALQQIKRLFFAKKAGHTGSLDPLASGILPICLGQATKIAGFLLNDDKRYFVRAQLGQMTNTGDSEGEVIVTQAFEHLHTDEIITTVQGFVGEIEQIPPMYSALKQNGQPLYKLARQGIEVTRKARPVTIYSIDYLSYERGILTVEVSCSKGTYIRTLMEDIGNKLGCGAHVVELRRTGFAQFDITQTVKFSDLVGLKSDDYQLLDAHILPSEDMLPNFQCIYLNQQQGVDICFGRKIKTNNRDANLVKIFDEKRLFLGIGEINNNYLQPKRLFV